MPYLVERNEKRKEVWLSEMRREKWSSGAKYGEKNCLVERNEERKMVSWSEMQESKIAKWSAGIK